MLEHEAGDDRVDAARRHRQRLGPAPGEAHTAVTRLRGAELRHRRIDAEDRTRACPRQSARDLALTGADVEHATEAAQISLDDRQDLFLVLRVGALGELVLPPLGVDLPRIGRGGRGHAADRSLSADPFAPAPSRGARGAAFAGVFVALVALLAATAFGLGFGAGRSSIGARKRPV